MSVLRDRVSWAGPSYPNLRHIATYGTVEEIPLVRIGIYPGVITYEDTYPLIPPDGAPIMATGKGTWGQLYRVGRF